MLRDSDDNRWERIEIRTLDNYIKMIKYNTRYPFQIIVRIIEYLV